MRFYQLEAKHKILDLQGDITESMQTKWFGVEREAVIERNSLFKSNKLLGLKRENIISPIDVPTDKAGLLKFLQNNVQQSVVV